MADAEQEKQAAQGETVEAEQSLLDQIVQASKARPSDDDYSAKSRAVKELIRELVRPGAETAKIHKSVVDKMIAELDAKLSLQVDQVLHHPDYQKLESSWRSLKFLVDRTDFRENNKIVMFNASKADLLNDFEDAPELTKSGLYKHAYTAGYGVFGGEPVGAIVGNYQFSHKPQDMKLLGFMASLAAMSHAPFVSAASPEFFGVESFTELPNLKDLKSIFEGPQYAKWRGFRESPDSRYVGLTSPRFLLRLPYGQETVPIKEFTYNETVTDHHESYLWGNTAFAFASRLTDSFAKYRWCPNIIGPRGGGAVEDLPVHVFEETGAMQQKIPTEVLISHRKEFELAEEGFIALTMRKDSDNACFFSAQSCQKPKFFGQSKEGKDAETNYKLGTQLPYMFVISRLAHYIKAIQTENIGSSKERVDLQRELETWIKQFVLDMDVADQAAKARRPLRAAKITVSDVEGDPGWYKVDLKVRPHFKYMGAYFDLALVGKLDK